MDKTAAVGECDNNTYANIVQNMKTIKMRKDRLRNQKVIKMLVIITTVFAVLWAPVFVCFLVRLTIPIPKSVWKSIQGLVLASTTTNFFVFQRMSPEFKKTCASLFRFKRVTYNVELRNISGSTAVLVSDIPTISQG